MAQRQKPLVGLDIDPVGISAAQVTVDDGRVSIVLAAHTPLEPGVIRDGEIADVEALTEALKALYRDNKDLDKRVRVGVANQKIVVRTIELPPLDDRKELDAAVRFQAQDEIPMPLDQAVLDWQPLEVVDTENGPRQRILLVAARRDMIERIVDAVKGAGLRLEGVDLGAFAMIRALATGTQEYSDEAVLYAEVGGLTNLAVARGSQCLFTRASGSGLEGLAVELAERRGLTLEHARGWLGHVGLDRPVQHIEGDREIVEDARLVLEEGVRRISAEIRQSLDFHHMQTVGGPGVARAVLTGGAISISGFAEAIGTELGLPMSRGSVPGEPEGVTPGDMTIAAGLACTGMPGVNMLPADERRAAGAGGRSGGAVYGVLGGLALVLVLLTAWIFSANGISSKETQLADVTAQADQSEQVAQSLQSYTAFASLRQSRVDTIRSLAASRFDWAHALGEIARTLPPNVWLSSLNGSVTPTDGSSTTATTTSTTSAAGASPTIVITGCTTSQENVARMMTAMRRIDGVVSVSLQSSKKGGGSGATGCGHDGFPNFAMSMAFSPSVAAPTQASAATASTASTATAPATAAATPAPTAAAPAAGAATTPTTTTPASTTSGGGAQ